MTVFALTTGAASATGQREIDPAHLTWGAGGSDYAEQRRLLTGESGSWLREVSSHDILREIIPAYFTTQTGGSLHARTPREQRPHYPASSAAPVERAPSHASPVALRAPRSTGRSSRDVSRATPLTI